MITQDFVYILLRSSNHVLLGEDLLKQANLSCKLIPVPRQISSDCGICIRIEDSDCDIAIQTLKAGGVFILEIRKI